MSIFSGKTSVIFGVVALAAILGLSYCIPQADANQSVDVLVGYEGVDVLGTETEGTEMVVEDTLVEPDVTPVQRTDFCTINSPALIEYLRAKYGEEITEMILLPNGNVIVLLESKTQGSWTVMHLWPGLKGCVLMVAPPTADEV